MATPWPEDQTWPADYREHATKLSTYLQAALKSINADGPPIDPLKVRHSILGTLSLIVKLQGAADLGRVREAIRDIQTEAKAAVEKTNKAIYDIRDELKNTNRMTQQTIASMQENANTAMAATAAAKEAMEVGKATMKMLPGEDLLQACTTPAMNPRNLKAHIDRAIEQSSNEHVNKIKVASSNQLKSGDLSIKTTTSADMEALRQFAEDWEQRIGNGATVRILTYGVLAHDNKPFIPNAEIKYVGWLTKSSSSKSASSVIVEFAKAEDANRIIDEGLIWQGEVFQCERYDRQCRLRQCFRCHKYGHIGTQCRATTACGYCAQDHPTRECPAKNDDMAPRKCAACRGEHEAWNSQCPTRKQELAKIKDAYKARPKYHPENPMPFVPAAGDSLNRTKETTRPGRPTLEPRQSQGTRPSRSRSPTKKIQKRQTPTSSQSHNENANLNINNATDPADAEKARPKRAYNVRKSKDTVMATLLRDPRIREYDILAIQEPWKNAFSETTHHPAKDLFHLCYPATEEGEPTRVCFFINNQLSRELAKVEEELLQVEVACEGILSQLATLKRAYLDSEKKRMQIWSAGVAALATWSLAHAVVIDEATFKSNGGDLTDIPNSIKTHNEKLRASSYETPWLVVGDIGGCTATWLGNEGAWSYVLTAAHCVHPEGIETAVDITFTASNGQVIASGKGTAYVPPQRVSKPPGMGGASTDIAILKLPFRNPMLDATGKPVDRPILNDAQDERGREVIFVGYGSWGVGMNVSGGYWPAEGERRLYGRSQIDSVFELDYGIGASFQPAGPSAFWARTAPGDSGSAWWQIRGDKPVIIATTNGGGARLPLAHVYRIAANVGRLIVLNIDISSAQQIYRLLAWWAVRKLAGKLKPVLLQKVRLVKFIFELIRIRSAFLGVSRAIVVIRVLVVRITEFGGRCMRPVLDTADLA
ncbi:restless-like transposase [Purpureocillium lavendulum]|uniref:Restless-like transposase n=1 Tax=Purpureocillium lavendulum TaxID=1247861 RepID=A0AB34FAL6_9HYPO|nr:restless-like transposase [Purpureocillium lavendulum]